MSFQFYKHDLIDSVVIIHHKRIVDDRGWFEETFNNWEFNFYANLDIHIVQENHSKSMKGVFRGLHYQQWPYEQGKLVRCASGSFMDYFVDMRKSSRSFGKVGSYLLNCNGPSLWIPRGFAHGVYILEDNTEIVYKVDNKYSSLSECGVYAPSLLDLPKDIKLSNKDENWPTFGDAVYFP